MSHLPQLLEVEAVVLREPSVFGCDDGTYHDWCDLVDVDPCALIAAIQSLKEKFKESNFFGVEKDKSFHSSIGQIYQTWDGQELYPSVEEKAAMLLYLVVKNHSFVDGNKRIAATLFLWFMLNNGILYRPDGTKRIAEGTLVALTLMIAESRMDEMDILVKVVVNLINRKQ